MDQLHIQHYKSLIAQNPDKKDLILDGAYALYSSGNPVNSPPDLDTILNYGKQYRADQPPEIVKGFKKATQEMQASGYGALGLVGSAVGSDKLRDYGYEGYRRNMEEAEQIAPRVNRLEDIGGFGDAADWFMGTLGSLGPSVIEAGAAALAGGGVGGLVAKKTAKEAVETAVEKYVAKKVAEGVAEKEARQVAMKTVADMAKKTAVEAGKKTVERGRNLGLVAGVAPVESGSMFGQAADDVGIENAKPLTAAGLGLVSAASEVLGPEGKLVTQGVAKMTRREALKHVPISMVKEGAQETFQQGLGDVNAKINNPDAEISGSGYLNAFAAGAVGGSAFSAPSVIRSWGNNPAKGAKSEVDKKDPRESQDLLENAKNKGLKKVITPEGDKARPVVQEELSGYETPLNEMFGGVWGGGSPAPSIAPNISPVESKVIEPVVDPATTSPVEPVSVDQAVPVAPVDDEYGGMGLPSVNAPISEPVVSPIQAMPEDVKPVTQNKPAGLKKDIAKADITPTVQSDENTSFVHPDDNYQYTLGTNGRGAPAVLIKKPDTGETVDTVVFDSPEKAMESFKALKVEAENWGKQSPGKKEPVVNDPAPAPVAEPGGKQSAGPDTPVTKTVIQDGVSLASSGNPYSKRGAQKAAATHSKTTGSKTEIVDVGEGRYGWRVVDEVKESPVDTLAHEAATSSTNDRPEPTAAQKEAGNYKKGHVSISGMDIAIENPEGSSRSGVSEDGKKWETKMNSHYGYFKRTEGKDGDQVDVFVRPGTAGVEKVHIVDQMGPDGKFDEHKVILGAKTKIEARKEYLKNYEKGWKSGPVSEMSVDDFKAWLKDGKRSKEPVNKDFFKEKLKRLTKEDEDHLFGKDKDRPGLSKKPTPEKPVELASDGQRSLDGTVDEDRPVSRYKTGAIKSLKERISGLEKEKADWESREYKTHGGSVSVGSNEEVGDTPWNPGKKKVSVDKVNEKRRKETIQRLSDDISDSKEVLSHINRIGEKLSREDANKIYYALTGDDVLNGGDFIDKLIETSKRTEKRIGPKKDFDPLATLMGEGSQQDQAEKEPPISKTEEPEKKKSISEIRANHTLDKPSTYSKYPGMTKRQAMEKAAAGADGSRVVEGTSFDSASKKRDQEIAINGRKKWLLVPENKSRGSNENLPAVKEAYAAIERLEKDDYKKPDYRLYPDSEGNSFWNITKTEYDYYKSIPKTETTDQKADQPSVETVTGPVKAESSKPKISPEQAIKISADDIESLRKPDVFRVLDTYSDNAKEIAEYIKSKRPELSDEVDDSMKELGLADKNIEISESPSGKKDIRVDMSKKEADSLKPKEQREYLLKEIDTAISKAPDRFISNENNPFKADLVEFHIPGDGSYSIINSKDTLTEFKKMAAAFPASDVIKHEIPSVYGKGSYRKSAIRPEGFPGEYTRDPYQPYKKNFTILKSDRDSFFTSDDYVSNGRMVIKKKMPGLENRPDVVANFLANNPDGSLEPIGRMVERYNLDLNTWESQEGANGKNTPKGGFINGYVIVEGGGLVQGFNPGHIDMMLTEFPDSEMFVPKKKKGVGQVPLFFKQGGEVVGVVMPYTDADKQIKYIKKHWSKTDQKTTPDRRQEPDKIKQLERAMVGRKNDGFDFFPTAPETVSNMLDIAGIKPDMKVLEPSAGMGHIADAIREAGVDPDVVEISPERRELLEAKGFNVVGNDFMDITGGDYDRIVMNPPFSNRRDAEHVRHAYDLLGQNGRIVAIMGEGVFFGQDKKAAEFREWLDSIGGTSEKLPEGSFKDPSLPVNTAVNARMIVIDKADGKTMPEDPEGIKLSKAPAKISNPSSISELTPKQRRIVRQLQAKGKVKAVTAKEAMAILEGAGVKIIEKYSKDGRIQGFALPDGRAFIIPENIEAGKLWGVVRHEVGVHLGRLMQKDKGFDRLKRAFEAKRNDQTPTGEAIRAAYAKVPKETPAGHVTEEAMAYLVESAPEMGFVKKILNFIKRMMVKLGMSPEIFTADDYVVMAEAALRREAKGNPSSMTGNDVETPLYSIADTKDHLSETFNETMEYLGDLYSRRGDLVTGIKGAAKYWNVKHPGDKADVTWFEKAFGLVSHYSKKIPAFARTFNHALRNQDIKIMVEQQLTHGENGEKFIEIIDRFRRKSKDEYNRLSDYLNERDMNKRGYTVKEDDGRFVVRDLGGKDTEFSFETEKEALEKAIALEVDDFIRDGGSQDAAEALALIRTINNRSFELRIQRFREVEQMCKDNGIEIPEIVYVENGNEIRVDLKQKLIEMGDMRGFYMPRIRKPGEHMLYATKRSQNPVLKYYDTRFFANAAKANFEKQGYSVTVRQAGKLSEDLFEQLGSVMAQQAVINESMKEINKGSKVVTFEDINIKKTMDGDTLVLSGEFKDEFIPTLEKMGGTKKIRTRLVGKTKVVTEYRFENPKKGLEQTLANELFRIDGVTNMFQTVALRFAGAFVSQYADMIRSRGSRSAMIGRSEAVGEDVTIGYEEDALTRVTKATLSLAGGEAKAKTALAMVQAITGRDVSWADFSEIKRFEGDFEAYEKMIFDSDRPYIDRDTFNEIRDNWVKAPQYPDYIEFINGRGIDPAKQKMAHSEAMAMFKDMMRNEERVDRVIGTMKGLAVLKYLGFRVAAPVVNMTNMVVGVPAAMMGYGNINVKKIPVLIGNAYRDYRKFKTKTLEHGELQNVFMEIEKRGWDQAQFNHEGLAAIQNKMQFGYSKMIETSMMLFSWSEKLNRVATITAAYNGLLESDPGMTFEERLNRAKEISDKAHGIYGKANRPSMMRGGSVGANVMQSFYVFKTFTHNFLATMYDLGVNKKDASAVLWMLFSPAIFGAGASMGASLLINAIGKAMGSDDPEEDFYKAVESRFGSYAGNFSRFGIFGTIENGISIKGSLNAVGVSDLPTSLGDIMGAPGSVLSDVVDGVDQIRQGNVMKGVESILPLAAGSPIKAYREYTEGITTKSNAPVFFEGKPLKADAIDAFLRAFSFNPSRIAGAREKLWGERTAEKAFLERRQEIYARLKKHYIGSDRDYKELQDINIMIAAYNARAKRDGQKLIQAKNIKAVLKKAKVE